MERVMEIVSRIADGLGVLQSGPHTAGVTLVIGVLSCFLGYRLLRAWISLAGFYMGVLLFYALASLYTDDPLIQFGAVLAGGLLLGIASVQIYRLGVFFLCTDIASTAASWILQPQDILRFMLCLGIGICVGLLGVAFVRPVVIFNTAVGGGLSAASSAAVLLKKEVGMRILFLGAALAVAGITVQIIQAVRADRSQEQDERDAGS